MGKYVVVDLEMCRVPKQMKNEEYHWGSETIQIGAVLLNDDYEVVDQFNTYVSPKNGQIDAYIQKLTGINRGDVKNAPNMKDALQNFISWLPDEDVKAVSWSNADEKQIRHEVVARNIEIAGLEELLDSWIDCQRIFGDKLNSNRCYKLSEALVAADISFEGREHDGLIDAYNTALLFAKIKKEPELALNQIYQNARTEESIHLQFSLGDMFTKLNIQQCVFG